MKITILCTETSHPIYPCLEQWVARERPGHELRLETSIGELTDGDILFLVSVHQLVDRQVRARFRSTLVIHASDLPEGRGWSPHVWQILEGRSTITVSVLDAEDAVDSGAIWAQRGFELRGDELSDEINDALFSVELGLMDHVIENFMEIRPRPQSTTGVSYYRRRTPEDSRLDPHQSIANQFELLRVADPARYPAFFDYRGCRYQLALKKVPTAETTGVLES